MCPLRYIVLFLSLLLLALVHLASAWRARAAREKGAAGDEEPVQETAAAASAPRASMVGGRVSRRLCCGRLWRRRGGPCRRVCEVFCAVVVGVWAVRMRREGHDASACSCCVRCAAA